MRASVRQWYVGVLLFLLLWFWVTPGFVAAATESSTLIIVNKETNELAYFKNGLLERTFPVGTGEKPEYTPEGTFSIVNKIKNRPYYTDNIPGGDPRNPLGDRWLGLDANGTYGTTYAIHGNNNPDSIGNYVSAGCMSENILDFSDY
jgi:lipoprotein-anchoring transpeptidase ErfK/SrfK